MQCRKGRSRKVSRCSTADRTNSRLSKSSTSQQNHLRYISSNQNCVLHAHEDSKWFRSKLLRRNPFLTRPIPHWTLLHEKRTFDPYTSNVSMASSYLIIRSSPSSSIATDGGRDQIGESTGKACPRALHSHILGYWLSSRISLRSETSIQMRCTSSLTRTFACSTPVRVR